MRLECKNAQVTLNWDKDQMMELIIRNQRGDILLMQTQGNKGAMTNIHEKDYWDEAII